MVVHSSKTARSLSAKHANAFRGYFDILFWMRATVRIVNWILLINQLKCVVCTTVYAVPTAKISCKNWMARHILKSMTISYVPKQFPNAFYTRAKKKKKRKMQWHRVFYYLHIMKSMTFPQIAIKWYFIQCNVNF